jgi:tetraacyldisaccharide 4'-kinase
VSGIARWLQARWYGGAPVPFWLSAAEGVFIALSASRRWLYRQRWLRSGHPGVPVIVVGNLVVGGSGKTPLVIALARLLVEAGYRPGVVSRGYGRRRRGLHRVHAASTAAEAGDEPLEIFHATGLPVAVAADRLAAARALVECGEVDCILSDDGLQHLRLRRDLEIVTVDAARGFGNGRRLPAGPLREPVSRLQSVDLVLSRNGSGDHAWSLERVGLRALDLDRELLPMEDWRGRPVNAVAGLADASGFFDSLRQAGLDLREARAFPDHHRFSAHDLQFAEPLPLVMTAKDAVKCNAFELTHAWVLEVRARLPAAVAADILGRLRSLARADHPS